MGDARGRSAHLDALFHNLIGFEAIAHIAIHAYIGDALRCSLRRAAKIRGDPVVAVYRQYPVPGVAMQNDQGTFAWCKHYLVQEVLIHWSHG